MAESKCRCGGTTFEAKSAREVGGIPPSAQFVQCSKCGEVVGALSGLDYSGMILGVEQRLTDKINGLSRAVAPPS